MKRQKPFPGVIMLSFHGHVSTRCALHAEMLIRVIAQWKCNWHLPAESESEGESFQQRRGGYGWAEVSCVFRPALKAFIQEPWKRALLLACLSKQTDTQQFLFFFLNKQRRFVDNYFCSCCVSLSCQQRFCCCTNRRLFVLSRGVWISVSDQKSLTRDAPQSATTNTNNAQSEAAELQWKIPPASPQLIKHQHPKAWINVATNSCNVSACERCHALPEHCRGGMWC